MRIKSSSLAPEVEIPPAPKPPRGSWGGTSYDSKGRGVKVGERALPLQDCSAGGHTTESIVPRPTKPGRW